MKGLYRNSNFFKEIDGELHKLCRGPGHDEPTWLPATDKYFYKQKTGQRKDRFLSRCRLCMNWEHLKSPGLSGYVPLSAALPFFLEAVRRVGLSETARRTGISINALGDIVKGKRDHVQKRTLRKVMLELISMRRKKEVRHRDSILHGSYLRGRTEKQPVHRRDLYHPQGDDDNTRRRNWNNDNPDRARAAYRASKRRAKERSDVGS